MTEVLAPILHSRPTGSTIAVDQDYWLEHCEGFRVECDIVPRTETIWLKSSARIAGSEPRRR